MIAVAMLLTACGSSDDGVSADGDTSQEANNGYGCDDFGATAVDSITGLPLVCDHATTKRGDPDVDRWQVDQSAIEYDQADVDTALADAIGSAMYIINGSGPANTPSLQPACEDLLEKATKAGDQAAASAAQYCVTQLGSMSGSNPASAMIPGILERLQAAQ